MASCHIPYYLDGRPTAQFRNLPAVDGGFVELVARVPGALNVSPFPTWMTRPLGCHVHVGPDRVRHLLPPISTLMAEILRPPSLARADALYEAGVAAVDEFVNRGPDSWPQDVQLLAEHVSRPL